RAPLVAGERGTLTPGGGTVGGVAKRPAGGVGSGGWPDVCGLRMGPRYVPGEAGRGAGEAGCAEGQAAAGRGGGEVAQPPVPYAAARRWAPRWMRGAPGMFSLSPWWWRGIFVDACRFRLRKL